ATENIIQASAELKDNNAQSLSYQFINYHRSDNYNGFQNALRHIAAWKGWQFNNELVATNFNTATDKGVFLRPVIDMSKELKRMNNWRLGFRYALEHNTARNKLTDTLTASAFSFDSYAVYLKSDERKKNRHSITFFTRSDKYAVQKDFIRG